MSDVRPAASGIKVQETHTTASEDTSPLGHRGHSGEAAFRNATSGVMTWFVIPIYNSWLLLPSTNWGFKYGSIVYDDGEMGCSTVGFEGPKNGEGR